MRGGFGWRGMTVRDDGVPVLQEMHARRCTKRYTHGRAQRIRRCMHGGSRGWLTAKEEEGSYPPVPLPIPGHPPLPTAPPTRTAAPAHLTSIPSREPGPSAPPWTAPLKPSDPLSRHTPQRQGSAAPPRTAKSALSPPPPSLTHRSPPPSRRLALPAHHTPQQPSPGRPHNLLQVHPAFTLHPSLPHPTTLASRSTLPSPPSRRGCWWRPPELPHETKQGKKGLVCRNAISGFQCQPCRRCGLNVLA